MQKIPDEESLIKQEELVAMSTTYNVTTEFILDAVKYLFPIVKIAEMAEFHENLSNMREEDLSKYRSSV